MSVYFATIREQNVVKIGCSFDPDTRLKELQVGCPFTVKIEATLPGHITEEQALHRRFADDRLRGEWFTITPMIEAIMAEAKKAEAARPKVPQIDPPGFPESIRARPKVSAPTKQQSWASRELRRREAAGDIHFPFRAKESA